MSRDLRARGSWLARRRRAALALVQWSIAATVLLVAGCGADVGAARTGEAPGAAVVELRYAIEGMTCDGCVQFLQKRIAGVDGVASCEVSLAEGTAIVRARDDAVGQAILESVGRTPYVARELR